MQQKNYTKQFVVFSYGLFWLMLWIDGMWWDGGIARFLFDGKPFLMRLVSSIPPWAPTIVFLLMFQKIYSGRTIKDFYKNAFSKKLNVPFLVAIMIIQTLIFFISVYIISLQKNVPIMSLLSDFAPATIVSALFFSLIGGTTGEESGWRGYLQPTLEDKFGVVRSSLIVGVIWAFWHTPIWFIQMGYQGIDLLKYIIAFCIACISLGFIIGILYYHNRNLLVPILLHWMFNFYFEFFYGNPLDIFPILAVFYFVMAVGVFIWHRHKVLSKNINSTKTNKGW